MVENNMYARIPHTFIKINGTVIETKRIRSAYLKFMYGEIENKITLISQPVQGINFHCSDGLYSNEGNITVTVDGKIRAQTSCSPCHIEKQLTYIKKRINEICNSLDITPYSFQTYITEGFRMDTKSIKSKTEKDESKNILNKDTYYNELIKPQDYINQCQTNSHQKGMKYFYIPPDHSIAPFRLKDVSYPDNLKKLNIPERTEHH